MQHAGIEHGKQQPVAPARKFQQVFDLVKQPIPQVFETFGDQFPDILFIQAGIDQPHDRQAADAGFTEPVNAGIDHFGLSRTGEAVAVDIDDFGWSKAGFSHDIS